MGDRGLDTQERIAFQCLGCGNCCRGEGFVTVSETEIERMAGYLKISVERFKETYTVGAIFGDYWIREKPNRDCIFLENNRCLVHPVKPDQCRSFPFSWSNKDSAEICPAMRKLASCGLRGGKE